MNSQTFEEAGSDADLRAAYLQGQGEGHRRQGDELITSARSLSQMKTAVEGRERAEEIARQALVSFASALNWAEGGADEDDAHHRMDTAGRWVRRTFGCHLHREGKSYSQRCPVALGHNRIGMSIGGAARRICSLCGGDLSECEHRRGIAYLVPGGLADLGWCRVCLKETRCDHLPNELYRVGVVSIIKEMELQEVSIVGKPAHPDARFTSVSVGVDELQDFLGPAFLPGMPVKCDQCLAACGGLVKHDDIPHG